MADPAFDFAALEDILEGGWHIDPKDKDPRSEERRQVAVRAKRRIYCPAVNLFAVPNGQRRSQWEKNKAHREGLVPGALDLVATWVPSRLGDRGVAFIEMKDGTGMPDLNQRGMLNLLHRQGHACGVFRQEMSVMRWLHGLGAPFLVPPS